MTPELWKKVRRIFIEALKMTPDAVPAFLDEACGGDEQLRAGVDSLLAANHEILTGSAEPAGKTGTRPLREAPNLVGHRVGEYNVEALIRSGGMGVVYKARQDRLGRTVALKTMKPGFDLQSFQAESTTLATLQHPGIVQVINVGEYQLEAGVIPYFTMEYIFSARHLTQHADEFDMTMPERLKLFADVCDAMAAAHHKGIAHLDLKPSNILVDANDEPKIIDFGVASVARSGPLRAAHGTGPYMSPEQRDGEPEVLDMRSDVYSLGVVLFELLCGELPHEIGTDGTVAVKPRRASALNPDVSPGIDAIITKATRKSRNRRYHSAADLADAVRLCLDQGDSGVPAPPLPWPVGLVVAVVAVLGLGALVTVLALVGRNGADSINQETVFAPSTPGHFLDVEMSAQWSPLRPAEPPERPTGEDLFSLTIRADKPGDLLIFEMGPDGATPFRDKFYEGPCEPLRYEPEGGEVLFPATFRGREAGLHGLVAVLVPEATDGLCEKIAEGLARGWASAKGAPLAWPDDDSTDEIRLKIEDVLQNGSEDVLGFGIYLFPVTGD